MILPAARQRRGTCFICKGGQARSEASRPGAGPTLPAKRLGAFTDEGHRAIKSDPSFSSSALKNSKVSYFFITS